MSCLNVSFCWVAEKKPTTSTQEEDIQSTIKEQKI